MKVFVLMGFVVILLACSDTKPISVEGRSAHIESILPCSTQRPLLLIDRIFLEENKTYGLDYSKSYPVVDTSRIEDLGYLKKLCLNYFLGQDYNITHIKSLRKIWEGELYKIGYCHVYKLDFGQNVPLSAGINTMVIVNLDDNVLYRVNLQTFEPTVIRKELPVIFSGRYFFRGGGAFYSYYSVNDTLYNFFESDVVISICKDDECKCYKNDKLQLRNADINADGLIDLEFFGWEYNFCIGYASRADDNTFPLDSTYIKRVYLLRQKDGHFYYDDVSE